MEELLDAKSELSRKEARKALKSHHNKVANGSVSSFVSLQNINKIYPNGVQAVYDFNLEIQRHEFIVLVGPSGCGKSTTLSMVAGLNEISSGYLYIDKVLSNYLPAKDRDISMVFQSYALYPQMSVYDNIAFPLKVRKYHKPLIDGNYRAAFEDETLLQKKETLFEALGEAEDPAKNHGSRYAYLSSRLGISDIASKWLCERKINSGNFVLKERRFLAFLEKKKALALKKAEKKGYVLTKEGVAQKDGSILYEERKLTGDEIREKVFTAAKMLDLGNYLDRRPKELSGGQMQRVALGRAIVRDAKLFLMDEPLSNLDAKLRVQMRSEIVRLHEAIGATTIYVTHDQTEAMTMADRIVVMSKGYVQQVGAPQEVYSHPKNLFVATFIGSPAMNIFVGRYEDGKILFQDGYAVDMGDGFKKEHDDFYRRKIAECQRMLLLADEGVERKAEEEFLKIRALKGFQKEAMLQILSKLEKTLDGLQKPSKTRDLAALEQARQCLEKDEKSLSKESKRSLEILHRSLLDIETISNADLAKIHSAQAFGERKEEKKAAAVLSYRKPSDSFFARMKKKTMSKKSGSVSKSQSGAKEFIESLLRAYEEALKGPHSIKIGIRPEHIHLDKEYANPAKTAPFTLSTGLVELLGNELLVHAEWEGSEMIAKISTGTLVKAHSEAIFSMNGSKLHVFDVHSGDTIH